MPSFESSIVDPSTNPPSILSPSREAATMARPWQRRSRQELEADSDRLKSELDLFAIAEMLGYSEGDEAGKMTNDLGETIAIGIARNSGHWVWIHNSSHDAGSAADLIMRHFGCGFGPAMKRLRRMAAEIEAGGGGRDKPATAADDQSDAEWLETWWKPDFHPFLNGTRGLAVSTTLADRFAEQWAWGEHGNAVFPYRSFAPASDAAALEIVGVEKRNRAPRGGLKSYRRYTRGGRPGIWHSRVDPDGDRLLIISESPIDAMSIYELQPAHQQAFSRFAAVRAGVRDDQLRTAIASLPAGGVVVAATDGDEAGEKYAEQLARCAEAEGRKYRRFPPPGDAKDWNDFLINRKSLVL